MWNITTLQPMLQMTTASQFVSLYFLRYVPQHRKQPRRDCSLWNKNSRIASLRSGSIMTSSKNIWIWVISARSSSDFRLTLLRTPLSIQTFVSKCVSQTQSMYQQQNSFTYRQRRWSCQSICAHVNS